MGEMGLELKVRFVPHYQDSAAMSLAKEESLFLTAKEELKRRGTFEPIIGLYSFSRPSVILGYQQPISEVNIEYCDNNEIDVTMRKSGGGGGLFSSEAQQ